MSLLQEMEHFGLADCEFNRQLIRNKRRINRLMAIYLPVFNDQFEDEPLTSEQAQKDGFFYYWLREWGDMDRRGELYDLLLPLRTRLTDEA
jgi:hypothetical protein